VPNTSTKPADELSNNTINQWPVMIILLVLVAVLLAYTLIFLREQLVVEITYDTPHGAQKAVK
jgi:heme/copper-type cytochrome/quinol oxidase subunit 2